MINTESGSKRIESSSVEQAQIEWAITEQMMNGVYVTDGGIGSGFFKHLGRKGKVDGSVKQGVASGEGFRTLSMSDAYDMAQEMGRTPDAMKTVGGYGYFCTNQSKVLNHKLRSGQPLSGTEQYVTDIMDKNMRPIPESIKVFRAMDPEDFFKAVGISPMLYKLAVGKVLRDKGFMSTSFDEKYNHYRYKGARIRINVPKGSKCFFNPEGADEGYVAQAEVAFARGSGLQITGIKKAKEGNKVYYDIEADLVQAKKND